MKTSKTVRTAGFAFGAQHDVLVTGGIGSCVVVCLWSSDKKIGAMAHIMLPDSDAVSAEDKKKPEFSVGIAPDTAVPHLLAWLKPQVRGGRITAKLVGGGNMFGTLEEDGIMGDTPKNIIRNTKEILLKNSVNVVAECLGGRVGRRLEFDVETGIVLIENVLGGAKRI